MLADEKIFAELESVLKDKGVIERFEKENGKIIGRMMIIPGDVPEDLKGQVNLGDDDTVFIGTFDFYDCSVGMAINTKTMQAKSGLWITEHSKSAEPPSEEWCEFFIETVVKYIRPDRSYAHPLYTFCSESADFTVVPTDLIE